MTLTHAEFRAGFRPVEPVPTITVGLSAAEWAWLDEFATRTGVASRSEAFKKVVYCGVVHVNEAQRELARQHRGPGGQTDWERRPWYFAEAFAALPAAVTNTDPAAKIPLTVPVGLQAKFGQFTDLGSLHSPEVAQRLFLAGREPAEAQAAERGIGPTFASVFPEVETLDPQQARAVVEAATEEITTRLVTDPAYAVMTVLRARGYWLGIVEFTSQPEQWYHPLYCAAADSEEAIDNFCAAHADACIEETGLEFIRTT